MPSKTQSILIGAVVYIVLGLLVQFLFQGGGMVAGIISCLIPLSSGLVAVWHYTSTHSLTIPAGQGAGMGALAGLAGAVVAGAIGYALIAAGILPDPVEAARIQMESQGMSDEQIDGPMAIVERFSNPVIGLAIGAVIGSLLGAVSGAIGAVIFKKGGDAVEPATEV